MPKQLQYPIIVEDFPESYTGPRFLTLIEYRNEQFVAVVDFVTSTAVNAFVLDLCSVNNIDVANVVSLVAANWDGSENKPVSVMFGSLGIARNMSHIHKTFPLGEISRVIGRFPELNLTQAKTVKRRRRREIDRSISVRYSASIKDTGVEDSSLAE